jgi:hypothetical protein
LGAPPKTAKETRRDAERELAQQADNIPFPGWDTLKNEGIAPATRYYLQITDSAGVVQRRLSVDSEAGVQRLSWDMRGAAPDAISFPDGSFKAPWMSDPQGALLVPGRYQAQLLQVGPEATSTLGQAQEFELRTLDTLPASVDYADGVAFQASVVNAQRQLSAINGSLKETADETRYLRAAVDVAPGADPALHRQIDAVDAELATLRVMLSGNPARQRLAEAMNHSAARRIYSAANALNTRMPPTATQREDLRLGIVGLATVTQRSEALRTGPIADIKAALANADAPWVPGQTLAPETQDPLSRTMK